MADDEISGMTMKSKLLIIGGVILTGVVGYKLYKDRQVKQGSAIDNLTDNIAGKIYEKIKPNKFDASKWLGQTVEKATGQNVRDVKINPDLDQGNVAEAQFKRIEQWRKHEQPIPEEKVSYLSEPKNMDPVVRAVGKRDRSEEVDKGTGQTGDPMDITVASSGKAFGQTLQPFETSTTKIGYGRSIGRWESPEHTAAWKLYEIPSAAKQGIDFNKLYGMTMSRFGTIRKGLNKK